MTARGQLQHHFWGTYAATIALRFESEADAGRAHSTVFPTWTRSVRCPEAITWHGSDPELETTIQTLVRLGADRDKIESLAHSIDYGDPFTIRFTLL